MTTPTFKHLLDFVMENKKDKTFFNMTQLHIINLLQEGLRRGTLLYHQDREGKIDGMILAELWEDTKTLFVTENLAMNMHNLQQFASIAQQRWPHYHLQWLKHGIHKHHPTERIYEKLGV